MWLAIFLVAVSALPNCQAAEPLKLHPENPHYFLFRGQPTVLITSGEHYGAVLNLDFNYLTYLDELQSKSLNLTRVFSGAYREVPGSFGIAENTLAPAPGRFAGPPTRTYEQVATKLGVSRWRVLMVASSLGVSRKTGPKPKRASKAQLPTMPPKTPPERRGGHKGDTSASQNDGELKQSE